MFFTWALTSAKFAFDSSFGTSAYTPIGNYGVECNSHTFPQIYHSNATIDPRKLSIYSLFNYLSTIYSFEKEKLFIFLYMHSILSYLLSISFPFPSFLPFFPFSFFFFSPFFAFLHSVDLWGPSKSHRAPLGPRLSRARQKLTGSTPCQGP